MTRSVNDLIFFPAIASASTTLGLLTIACVTCGMSPGGVRNAVGIPRFSSGKWIGVWGGAMVNGTMLAGLKAGPPFMLAGVPCARIDVPWGILASRATVSG